MASAGRPDIIVGIDIGQTCSGVAYSIGPDWNDPHNLNTWPGAHGLEKADKVATRVAYRQDNKRLQKWGFQCTFGEPGFDVREQFKLTLDYEYHDDRGFTCEDARKWYSDYLKCLHKQIESFFQEVVPNWRSMKVEYTFSTPTTWRNPGMIAKIEELIKEAGFGWNKLQTVRMGLTEAEAAAIDVSTNRYQEGDIFLICDSGGGTTDVNVVRVRSSGKRTVLEPLDCVEGVSVGSTLIDYRMTEHIVQRLAMIRDHLQGDPYYLAEEMLAGIFQTVKHSFPKPLADKFYLDVKGLSGTHDFPAADIVKSKMAISRDTLRDIFDQQVGQIFSLIDERLQSLQNEMPGQQVSYIILSGGFGSSPYLYEQLQRRYERNEGFRSQNTASIRIMKALEPQLTVVRGLVKERIQQLGTTLGGGQEVFSTRRCRNSYGVVVSELYSPEKHVGYQPVTRPDGRLWVESCVDWFVKQGEEISISQGVRKPYGSTIKEGEHAKPRKAQIVMSTMPVQWLPKLASDRNCRDVVMVEYRLTENDMELKNKAVWKFKKKYWKANFYFVVKIGPADMKFQIEGRNGVLSSSHESLLVEYMDSADSGQRPSADQPGPNDNALYR